jgi:hypothetical protein
MPAVVLSAANLSLIDEYAQLFNLSATEAANLAIASWFREDSEGSMLLEHKRRLRAKAVVQFPAPSRPAKPIVPVTRAMVR